MLRVLCGMGNARSNLYFVSGVDFNGRWCIVSASRNCTRCDDLAGCSVKKLEGTKQQRHMARFPERKLVRIQVTTSEKGADPVRKLAKTYLDEQNEENENGDK